MIIFRVRETEDVHVIATYLAASHPLATNNKHSRRRGSSESASVHF